MNFTIVENLGQIDKTKYKIGVANLNNDNLQVIPLEKISESILPRRFRTSGYLKSDFSLLNLGDLGPKKPCCSITDGVHKLDVSINFFGPGKLKRGDPVVISGIPSIMGNTVHFLIKSMGDIKKVEGETKPLNWLLKGAKLLTIGVHTNKKQKV
ncbi:uncharacterized protein LOC130673710 [Microplitis mediator]|uniref:uncharacterized protein LOC130673710 n=1 Tax=Microplitis mediator TaxID=375433 RepID=UPI00255212ED|nr:uncharacterized protein LOC130673710 [Microplitis mediator]